MRDLNALQNVAVTEREHSLQARTTVAGCCGKIFRADSMVEDIPNA